MRCILVPARSGAYALAPASLLAAPAKKGALDYDFVEGMTPGPGKLCAVMNDGTQIDVTMADGRYTGTSDEGHGYFNAPVNVFEVDYIQFGDLVIPAE